MIRNLFVFVAGISKQELDEMLKCGVIDLQGEKITKGSSLLCWLNEIDKTKGKLNSLKYHNDDIEKVVDLFRKDLITLTKNQLIGMEIKRPCQYKREWIVGFIDSKIGDVDTIVSNTGSQYRINKVKVYDTEDTTVPLYAFASELLASGYA